MFSSAEGCGLCGKKRSKTRFQAITLTPKFNSERTDEGPGPSNSTQTITICGSCRLLRLRTENNTPELVGKRIFNAGNDISWRGECKKF